MIAHQFIAQGYTASCVLKAVGLSASVFYYRPSEGEKGRKRSTYTLTAHGVKIDNKTVVEEISDLLRQEFVDYGYQKVTWWLRNEKMYIINFKKVYLLMKINKLLYRPKIRNRSGKQWVKDLVPQPEIPFSHLEFDIKYIYIHGAKRNALLLTVIDVKSRLNMRQYLAWSITKSRVVEVFQYIVDHYRLPDKITVRNDNGSQFESQLVRDFLQEKHIVQEFTQPATPQQNGHIESYHSIVERTICRQYDFDDLPHAEEVFDRFHYFYNYKRIHSGIGYRSPVRYLQSIGISDDFNKDFYLRGWRLETTANKQAFEERKGASAPLFPLENLSLK